MTSTRDRSSIRVYMVSPRLIHKKMILELERGIRDQLFPGKQLTVKIMEKYRLSGQYNPEKLLKIYRESIQTELKNYSMLEYNMFRNADITFPETDLMRMVIEDTMIARDKAGELKRILEKIFTERCGLPVEVQVEYKEARKRRREEEPVIVPFPGRAGQGQAADTGNGGYDRAGAVGAGADGYYQNDGGEAPPWEENRILLFIVESFLGLT